MASTPSGGTPPYDASTRIHGHYDIPNHEFAYVLATTIVGPVRWIETYGWRGLDENELIAITRVTIRFGELMGIKGLPNTYDGYLNLLVDYEREHFAPDPANTALAEASIDIARATMPAPARPLVRPMVLALMDQPLLDALGLDRPRAWFASAVEDRTSAPRLGPAVQPTAYRTRAARGPHLSDRPLTEPVGADEDDRCPECTADQERGPCLSGRYPRSRTRRFPSHRSSVLRARSDARRRRWEAAGIVDREVWRKAGAAGLLCFDVAEEYGGAGVKDFRYNMVLAEEAIRAGASGPGFAVHGDDHRALHQFTGDRGTKATLAAGVGLG